MTRPMILKLKNADAVTSLVDDVALVMGTIAEALYECGETDKMDTICRDLFALADTAEHPILVEMAHRVAQKCFPWSAAYGAGEQLFKDQARGNLIGDPDAAELIEGARQRQLTEPAQQRKEVRYLFSVHDDSFSSRLKSRALLDG
jgi:hypothetical protein